MGLPPDTYNVRYKSLFEEMKSDFDEFWATWSVRRARQLTEATGQRFDDARLPQYFTGDLSSRFVLVHLNPVWDQKPLAPGDWRATTDFDTYVETSLQFGTRMYGPASARTHRSRFDAKQITFLREFGLIEFVTEQTKDDRFINLQRAIDRKLQVELIPYGSASFSPSWFTSELLEPHFHRVLDVIATEERDYVLLCGTIFERLLPKGSNVEAVQRFRLIKRNGVPERMESRFANVSIPFEGRTISAGLAYSWARQGLPMASYAKEIVARYGH
jgi:hypothetical protein